MVLGGTMPVGSSRPRLDPLGLPVRFTASDAGADERQRQVELDRDRVVLRRAVRGIRMAVKLPISAFRGVALRLDPGGDTASDRFEITLEHRDPSLTVPLCASQDGDDIVAEWQLWARVLGCRLLVREFDGSLSEPFQHMGTLHLGAPAPRRRRRNAIKRRRPSILLRRRPGRAPATPIVMRDEREIIARN